MTGSTPDRIDAAPAGEPAPELRGVTREAGDASAAPVIGTGNVVPFARPRDAVAARSAPEVALDPTARPAAWFAEPAGRARIRVLLAVSLMVHGALYLAFNRDPEPLSSIGLEAISVEIVLGATTPAGLAAAPEKNEVQNAPADDPDPQPTDSETATAKPEAAVEAKPVEEARAAPESTTSEAKFDQPTDVASRAPSEVEKQQVAALPVEPMPPSPDAVLPEPAKPEPAKSEPAKPEPPKPQAVRPPPKPEPAPKPVRKRDTKPTQEREEKPKPEREGPRSRTASIDPHATGARSNSANGVGVGRSQSNANYYGLVSAHLARYKQYPAEARSRGEQGAPTVSFSLDGNGRVTRVALVRGIASASLNQEVQAMVRRASPFPAPPDGRPVSFTQTVGFRIH